MSETLFTFLVVVTLVVAWRAVTSSASTLRLVAFGVLVGLAVLTRGPGLGLLVVPAFTLRARDGTWHGARRVTAWAAVGMLLALAPWTLRNGLQVGVWTLTSTNNATALCAGNRDGATGQWIETPSMLVDCLHDSPWDDFDIHSPDMVRPDVQAEADARGLTLGTPDEPAWYRRTVGRSVRWMVTHPVEELELTARRAAYALSDDNDPQYLGDDVLRDHPGLGGFLRVAANLWYWTVMALAVLAIVRFREARRSVHLWGTALALFAFVLVGVAYPQFRLPAMPLVVVLASIPIARTAMLGTDAAPATRGEAPAALA